MNETPSASPVGPTTAPPRQGTPASRFRSILLGIGPLILLAAVIAGIFATDAGLGDRNAPPIETLSVQQVRLPEPGLIEVRVMNDGPDEISIAQVRVDDAYWQFEMEPSGTLGRMESATITIPYPWVEDEAHAITILSSTGVVFAAEVPVAIQSPQTDRESVARFTLVGLYVGVVPITLGLLWYPFLRRIGRKGMQFVLALTIGLLIFLIVDMFEEAQEIAAVAPASLDTSVLVPMLAILTAGFLATVGYSLRKRRERAAQEPGGLPLAYQIAIGIGLHNLGEGLAIGSAFAIGEAALGVFLIVGFTLHNVTEGVGIAAPVVRHHPGIWHFLSLALIAGGPAVIGVWIGAFTYSPFWTAVFLAVGVGAILQVIIEIARLVTHGQRQENEPALTWTTFSGLTAGIVVMYLTALLVA